MRIFCDDARNGGIYLAKTSYKIPDSIDKSSLETEIYLKNKEGVGLNKPVTLYMILLWFVSFVLLFYIYKSTFLGQANLLDKIVFGILWVGFSGLFLTIDQTRRYGYHLFLTMLNYLSKTQRNIKPGKRDPIASLRKVNGIGDVRKTDGLVQFWSDGTVGYVYRVVGNASALMFDHDKVAVVDAYANFLKQVGEGVNIIFETGKEAQNVDRQLKALAQRQKERLTRGEFISPGLNALNKQQYDVLKNHIGGSFKSLHQYMIIKAKNVEELYEAEMMVVNDLQTHQLMFKFCERLGYEGTIKYFQSIYSK